MINLIIALALLLAPLPQPAATLPGAPGLDGAGSVRIVWTQQTAATYVAAVVVRSDGSRQTLFYATLPDGRKPPWWEPVPTWPAGKAWPIYLRQWEAEDRLVITEEVREFSRIRRAAEYGPLAVEFRVWLPVVAQAP